jgi:hypothetical protein
MDSVVKLKCACKEYELKKILSRCSTADGHDLCNSMKTAVVGVFPLLCTRLKSMGHFTDFPNKENASNIKQYLLEKSQIIIPKKIILKCGDKQAYFGPALTKIPDRELDIYGLKEEDLEHSYRITLNKEARVQDIGIEPNVDCNEDDDDSGTDVSLSNSDIFTPDNSGSDSNESSDEFMSPPIHESTLIQSQNEESSQSQDDQSMPVQDHSTLSHVNISNQFVDDSSDSSHEDNYHPSQGDLSNQPNNNSNLSQEDDSNQSQENHPNQSQENHSNQSQEIHPSQSQENHCYQSQENHPSQSQENHSNQSQENHPSQNQENHPGQSQENHSGQSQENHPGQSQENHSDQSQEDMSNRNESQNCGNDDDTESFPKEKMKYMNMFLHPEKCSSEDINNLIHCTKTQFLDFVQSIRPHLEKLKVKRRPTKLSIYSSAFLFRMRLACNWSFSKLSTIFVITKKAARTIYNKVLKICYKHTAAIPNVLNSQEDVEKLFDRTYAATDPFIKELFAPFADPLGKINTVIFQIFPFAMINTNVC